MYVPLESYVILEKSFLIFHDLDDTVTKHRVLDSLFTQIASFIALKFFCLSTHLTLIVLLVFGPCGICRYAYLNIYAYYMQIILNNL